jgi:DNA-binding NtrC family response regulator
MVVDDEHDIAEVMRNALEKENFLVDTFNDPQLALKQFQPNYYDLILLDIRMPKLNGFELYRELKKKDDKIKVCFITAFEIYYDEFKRMFPSLRVTCFVRKPVRLDKLVKIIREELELEEDRKITEDNQGSDKGSSSNGK